MNLNKKIYKQKIVVRHYLKKHQNYKNLVGIKINDL